jgi:hypothetical protein
MGVFCIEATANDESTSYSFGKFKPMYETPENGQDYHDVTNIRKWR